MFSQGPNPQDKEKAMQAVDVGMAPALRAATAWEDGWLRLTQLCAVLAAIEFGELLSDLPSAPEARARHAAGVGLLALLERELEALAEGFRVQAVAAEDAALR
jgi:hypothetical protein